MFTKPINEITFEDVESFCKEWAEGVRVEYKTEIKYISKIVSSFANTYGGIFLIGVETDQKNNRVTSMPGIPQRNGIEEQIQQSALTGIYPGVIPEIKVVDTPNSNNVIVIVRVDESIQAPHAIKDVTQVYVRVGSITQPYEYKLADMDRIAYMFKRREDSQAVARNVLNRIEARAGRRFRPGPDKPDLTIIAKPIFPYRPVISVSDIYKLYDKKLSAIRRVEGGIFYTDGGRYVEYLSTKDYIEFNEYGIAYRKSLLSISDNDEIDCDQFLFHLKNLIKHTIGLYKNCEYLGNIEIRIQLQEVLRKILIDPRGRDYREEITGNLNAKPECSDTEVFASKQCFARDLENEEIRKDIVEDLMCQLLWAFNVPIDKTPIREKVRKRIERDLS